MKRWQRWVIISRVCACAWCVVFFFFSSCYDVVTAKEDGSSCCFWLAGLVTLCQIFLWSRSESQGPTPPPPSADTQHNDSACKAPDTGEEHGLLHRTDKYFLQTHIFKPTLLLRASKAGGRQAMGNGRTEQGASILITVKKKIKNLKKVTLQMSFKKRFFSYSFITLLCGARMKPGKEHFNSMLCFESHFVLTFCKICWFYFTFCFCLILSGFEPAFLYITLCSRVFPASRVLVWLIGANIWNTEKLKSFKEADYSYFRKIWCWLGLASFEVAVYQVWTLTWYGSFWHLTLK